MAEQSTPPTKAQLDKSEREHLEDVVIELRETVEADIRYKLEHTYELNEEDGGEDLVGGEADTRELLVEAVEQEDGDKTWEEKFEQYVMGLGYTFVNRITALRCMEVRGFIDRPVTQFTESGTTPAGEELETKEFLPPEEAIIEAYQRECKALADEIEILFDPNSPYSIISPDVDTYKTLCEHLDSISDEVWRADDVLGWVYEYYNRPLVEALDAKNTLEPEDVGPANQFYTPHWVVRMLTDNSLGKLYLEATDQTDTVPNPEALSTEERKNRPVTPEGAPEVPDLCTYLIPDDEQQEAPGFDHPQELRVIDPACGSGHFLLYAFDVLERIWWAETDLDHGEIPAQILEHNLYGVDIDLRSCQLAAFNLYLKARERAEEEDNSEFEMPKVNIVCADSSVAEIDAAMPILDEITEEETRVRNAIEDIVSEFQTTEALGSLLDVRGELSDEFMQDQTDIVGWADNGPRTLHEFLTKLRTAVEENTEDSFSEQNLRSFLNLLVVLTQEYDVALMNPPYGSRGRMPKPVKKYVKKKYEYDPEYYINFFEVCDNLVSDGGRVGMLIKREFMFKLSFDDFRKEFIGERGSFDFVAEYGIGLLDKATVRNAGAVVRIGGNQTPESEGDFIRLHDIEKGEKEKTFLQVTFSAEDAEQDVTRWYTKELSEFELIPGSHLSYWVPRELRSIYDSEMIIDAENAGTEKESLGVAKVGLQTGKDPRFLRKFWEAEDDGWKPFAKGGEDAWIFPRIPLTVWWKNDGKDIRRYDGSYPRNDKHYFKEGLTYTAKKESGRRFGYLPEGSIFAHIGSAVLPDYGSWQLLSFTNSALSTYLMLAQTPDRSWEVGNVAKIPCEDNILESDNLEEKAREIAGALYSKRKHEFRSPHYNGPIFLHMLGEQETLPSHADHPHRKLRDELKLVEPEETVSESDSLEDAGIAAARHHERIEKNLQDCADKIDEEVFDCFDITDEQREIILQEIALRTNEDPREHEEYDPDSITEPPENLPEMVKDLLLHLTLRVVHEEGVVSLSAVDQENELLELIETEFERIFGEYAEDRLAETDSILGDRPATEEAYPNLRRWLEEDLFEYHVSKFENTPILWRLTTERLVSDPKMEGFACLVDYHQLDASLFDSIESKYLEHLKSEYREHRNIADQRRSDQSLSTSEQAEAAENYERYESALQQLAAFEEAALELSSEHPRDWDEEMQSRAEELAPKVAEFRERTEERLTTLDELVDEMEPDEFEDTFSPTFLERVNENRDEWIEALKDLEEACQVYSKSPDQPVEAHLYDLFKYFDDLVGSTHYRGSSIFTMNYYFSKGKDYLEDGEPREGLPKEMELLAVLGAETDEDVELGEEIKEGCDELTKAISSNWQDRAIAEVMAAGYDPVKKHGVAINIQPLAEKKIVPEIVEDKVIN